MSPRLRPPLALGLAASALLMLALALLAPLPNTTATGAGLRRNAAGQPPEPAAAEADATAAPQLGFREVCALFARPRAAPAKEKPPAAPAVAASYLHLVGTVVDASGLRWLLFKDDRGGRVLKLRADGAAAEEGRLASSGPGGYVIESKGQLLVVGRK